MSQIRLSQMRDNVLPRLKTADEKRRVLRSTMALDYLQSKNVRKKIIEETSVRTDANMAANAAMLNYDAQIQQVSIAGGTMAATGKSPQKLNLVDMNIVNAWRRLCI